MKRNTLITLLLAMAPLAILSACGGGDGDDSLDDRLDIADPKVRFINAIPASPNVTLYREATAQADATNVGYKFASKYYDVSTDNVNWSVKTTTGNLQLGTAVINTTRGNKYTIVSLAGDSQLAVVRDPYNKSLTSDKARVRVLNASFNQTNVDAYLTPAGTNLATVTPNFAGVAYKAAVPASDNDSLEFNGGTYQLRLTAKDSKTVIFNANVTLGNNADWLLLTIPDAGSPAGVKVLVAKADDDGKTTEELSNQPL